MQLVFPPSFSIFSALPLVPYLSLLFLSPSCFKDTNPVILPLLYSSKDTPSSKPSLYLYLSLSLSLSISTVGVMTSLPTVSDGAKTASPSLTADLFSKGYTIVRGAVSLPIISQLRKEVNACMLELLEGDQLLKQGCVVGMYI